MKRSFVISGIVACFLLGVALVTQGSGIVPAIVPALVPTANKTSTTGTVFALASSNALTPSTAVCTNANGDMTTTACTTNAVTSVTPATANTNSTNDQQLMELSLSAGYLNSLGRPFELYGAGVYTIAAGTPTLEFKIKLCTVSGCGSGTVVTLVDITTTATVVLTANNWDLRVNAVTAATGAMGNLETHGPVVVDLGSLITTADSTFGDTNSAVSNNIDLTAALFVDWTIKFSTNQAGANAMTQREGIVNPGGSTAGGGGGVTSVNGATGAVILPVLTAPVQGNWSNFNTTGAVQVPTFGNSRWEFAVQATAGDNWQGVQIALPGVPYSKVFRVWPLLQNTAFAKGGVGFTDGTKLVVCAIDVDAANGLTHVAGSNWNSVSSFNGGITSPTGLSGSTAWPSGNPVWFRLSDDNTNWKCDVSSDGQFWLNFVTEPRNTFLTATQLIVAADSGTSNLTQKIVFDSYQ